MLFSLKSQNNVKWRLTALINILEYCKGEIEDIFLMAYNALLFRLLVSGGNKSVFRAHFLREVQGICIIKVY